MRPAWSVGSISIAAKGSTRSIYGALILRRRDGATWQDAIELLGGPLGHAGDQILRIFAALEVHRRHDSPAAIRGRGDVVLCEGGDPDPESRALGLRAELMPPESP